MGLFGDIFSGKNKRNAAKATATELLNGQSAIDARLQGAEARGIAALNEGRTQGIAALDGAQPGMLDAIREGRDLGLAEYDRAEPLMLGSLDTGYAQTRADLERGRDRFAGWADTGKKAFDRRADAAGLNGQAGYDRVLADYRQSPGVKLQIEEATEEARRAANADNMLAGGNTMVEIATRAQGLADKDYDSWDARLGDMSKIGYDATGRMAGFDADLAGAATAHGKDRGAIIGHVADRRSGLYSGAGEQSAGIMGDLAKSKANVWTGTGSNIANLGAGLATTGAQAQAKTTEGLTKAINSGFNAGDEASANAWNAGISIANIGASLLGGGAGKGMSMPKLDATGFGFNPVRGATGSRSA